MLIEKRRHWEDCPYRTCLGTVVRLAYGGTEIEALVNGGEIVKILYLSTDHPLTPVEAAELAQAVIQAAREKETQEEPYMETLYETIAKIERDIKKLSEPDSAPILKALPPSRYACWEEEDQGKKRVRCAKTPFTEIIVPKRWATVKRCYPTYGYLRDTECDREKAVVETQVVETKEGEPPPNIELLEGAIRPTEKARQEALRQLTELLDNLLAFIASGSYTPSKEEEIALLKPPRNEENKENKERIQGRKLYA